MDNEFLSKVVTAIGNFANQVRIFEQGTQLKITCDCVYCGRSQKGDPHLGIVIIPDSDGKLTGGINCFRCGARKPLKNFLLELKEALQYHGISEEDIHRNVKVVPSDEKSINVDLQYVVKQLAVDEMRFYSWVNKRYENNKSDLRRDMIFKLNAFIFIKNRLKLNAKVNYFNASRLMKELKAKCYINKDKKFVLTFDNKVRYIFDKTASTEVELLDDRDITLFNGNKLPYVFNSYTKLKNPPNGDIQYYIISDKNKSDEVFDAMNVYVCEGVFDALSIKYYKNLLSIDEINSIEKNIFNLYVAMCHSRIDKFVIEYLNGIIQHRTEIPSGVKELNFVMVPDLNMNVQKYIHSIYKYIRKNEIQLREVGMSIQIFYLDLFDSGTCYGDDEIDDINDIVKKFTKRAIRNIELVRVF